VEHRKLGSSFELLRDGAIKKRKQVLGAKGDKKWHRPAFRLFRNYGMKFAKGLQTKSQLTEVDISR